MAESKTVLVIDDDPLITRFFQRILTHLGYQPIVALSSLTGLEAFQQHAQHIYAVILDCSLPDQTWQQTARKLCEIRSDTRIVLCSGALTVEEHCEKAPGIVAHLPKPFTFEGLSEALSKAAPSSSL